MEVRRMAYYTHSSNSTDDFRQRLQEIRDRMYPNTVPAHRRKRGTPLNPSVYDHIAEQQKKKGMDLRARRTY